MRVHVHVHGCAHAPAAGCFVQRMRLRILTCPCASVPRRYEYSLGAFLTVFNQTLNTSKKDVLLENRLHNIIEALTFDIYSYTCLGLFEKHKLMFSFQMTIKILEGGSGARAKRANRPTYSRPAHAQHTQAAQSTTSCSLSRWPSRFGKVVAVRARAGSTFCHLRAQRALTAQHTQKPKLHTPMHSVYTTHTKQTQNTQKGSTIMHSKCARRAHTCTQHTSATRLPAAPQERRRWTPTLWTSSSRAT